MKIQNSKINFPKIKVSEIKSEWELQSNKHYLYDTRTLWEKRLRDPNAGTRNYYLTIRWRDKK